MNSTASILISKRPYSSIGLNKNQNNPIELLDSKVVDFLLQDYADLIDVRYTPWFAKRFYNMTFELIHQLASQARQDAKDSQRLFAHLVKKNSV